MESGNWNVCRFWKQLRTSQCHNVHKWKTLGRPGSGEHWCETNTNTSLSAGHGRVTQQQNVLKANKRRRFCHCEHGSQRMTTSITPSNQCFRRVILGMWVHTHDQRFWGWRRSESCCCFTAGNLLSAEITHISLCSSTSVPQSEIRPALCHVFVETSESKITFALKHDKHISNFLPDLQHFVFHYLSLRWHVWGLSLRCLWTDVA